MTTVTSHSQGDPTSVGIDMTHWGLGEIAGGEIVDSDSNSATIRAGDHTYVLRGHDFAYVVDNGVVSLASGTLTKITVYPFPPPPPPSPLQKYDLQISDFTMDVQDFNAFVDANDTQGFQRTLLSGDDHLEGSAKRDTLTGLSGDDRIDGASGDDSLIGGKGNDVMIGGAGADAQRGGSGTDIFLYHGAADSGGGVYDVIDRFNTRDDFFLVSGPITAVDEKVDAGTSDSFNVEENLEAALDAGHFGAHHAVVVTVVIDTGPGLANGGEPPVILETFVCVDLNGVAGYQSGEDLAILIGQPQSLSRLGVDDFLWA